MGSIILAVWLLGASTALAAFPGQNGKIAFPDRFSQASAIYPNGRGITLLASASCAAYGASWSPGGDKYAYTHDNDCESTPHIFTLNADGSGLDGLGLGEVASWSPDGTRLVIFHAGSMWTMNADGTNRMQVPNSLVPDIPLSWSPDGTTIAFRRESPAGIHTIRLDGTNLQRLTTSAGDTQADWSPDGSKLVYGRQIGTVKSVWTMNADGTNQSQIAADGFGPSWAPDGTRIAYGRSDRSLHTMNPDGTGDRLVLDEFVTGGFSQFGHGQTSWQPCPVACPAPVPAYDTPAQAFTLKVALVPNFRQTISSTQCQARGGLPSSHGAPLAFGSCNPPGYVPGTVAHQRGDRSEVEFFGFWGDETSTNGNQADVTVNGDVKDVRTAAGGAYDPNPGFPGDDVTLVAKIRLSDRFNGSTQGDPATVQDFEVSVPGICSPSTTSPGSNCHMGAGLNGLMPGLVNDHKDTVLQIFRVRINDSGANGTRGDSDDRTFATQGIYIP